MSNLFKLWDFLSIEEAQIYLSDVLSKQISLADVYRLVLNKHLSISVRFLEPTYVTFCQEVDFEIQEDDDLTSLNMQTREWLGEQENNSTTTFSELTELENPWGNELISLYSHTKQLVAEPVIMSSLSADKHSDTDFVSYFSDTHRIDGVWDIKMAGSGITLIENLYQLAIDGVEIHGSNEPIWITDGKVVGQIQRKVKSKNADLMIDINKQRDEYCKSELKNRGVCFKKLSEFVNKNSGEKQDVFFEFIANESYKMIKPLSDYDISTLYDWFFSSHSLPPMEYNTSTSLAEHKHQLVIRTSELTRFTDGILGSSSSDKEISTKEKNTFLTMIFSLCHQLNIDPGARGVTSAVAAIVEKSGASISERTIRDILHQVHENRPS